MLPLYAIGGTGSCVTSTNLVNYRQVAPAHESKNWERRAKASERASERASDKSILSDMCTSLV